MEVLSYVPTPGPEPQEQQTSRVISEQTVVEPPKLVKKPSTIQTALCQFTFNCEEIETKQPEKVAEVPAKTITPCVSNLVIQEEVVMAPPVEKKKPEPVVEKILPKKRSTRERKTFDPPEPVQRNTRAMKKRRVDERLDDDFDSILDNIAEQGASVLKYEFIQKRDKKVLIAKRCSKRNQHIGFEQDQFVALNEL